MNVEQTAWRSALGAVFCEQWCSSSGQPPSERGKLQPWELQSWLMQGQQCPALWLSREVCPPGLLLPRLQLVPSAEVE